MLRKAGDAPRDKPGVVVFACVFLYLLSTSLLLMLLLLLLAQLKASDVSVSLHSKVGFAPFLSRLCCLVFFLPPISSEILLVLVALKADQLKFAQLKFAQGLPNWRLPFTTHQSLATHLVIWLPLEAFDVSVVLHSKVVFAPPKTQNPNFFGQILVILDFGSLCSSSLVRPPAWSEFWISDFGFWTKFWTPHKIRILCTPTRVGGLYQTTDLQTFQLFVAGWCFVRKIALRGWFWHTCSRCVWHVCVCVCVCVFHYFMWEGSCLYCEA